MNLVRKGKMMKSVFQTIAKDRDWKSGSDIYLKSNYATFCKKLPQDFCILTVVYTKSYHSEKALKTVNNTPTTEIWRLLI